MDKEGAIGFVPMTSYEDYGLATPQDQLSARSYDLPLRETHKGGSNVDPGGTFLISDSDIFLSPASKPSPSFDIGNKKIVNEDEKNWIDSQRHVYSSQDGIVETEMETWSTLNQSSFSNNDLEPKDEENCRIERGDSAVQDIPAPPAVSEVDKVEEISFMAPDEK